MQSLSVLIVDDNLAARKLLRSVLMGLNLRIMSHEAVDGITALKQIESSFYHLIFLDIEMPKMNGFEVLEKVLLEIPEQFVVIVSANATIVNVQKTIKLGGKGFIVKPYTSEKVKAVVDKYLKLKEASF